MLISDKVQRLKAGLLHCLHRFLSVWDKITVAVLSLCLAAGAVWYVFRYTPSRELALRQQLVSAATVYLGYNEADGSHRDILAVYNAQESLPRDYAVTDTDSWCAVFGSTAAIQAGLEEYIPLECSCGQLIELYRQQGNWVEADWYLPRPGDYILYDWDNTSRRDSGGWPDHVGIVVQTFGPVVKVIEGNKEDMVAYRYVFLDDPWIRGYGTPDYSAPEDPE